MKTTYILADIFKNKSHNYDCSLDGISNRFSEVYVPVKGGYFTREQALADKERAVLEVGTAGNRTHLRPYGEKGHFAAGGCFVYACDSRFRESLSERPMHLHDRDMNKERK